MQILAGLFLLAVLIIVHEFGHFITAKLMGVRVLTFSIGFGPKLFSFKKGGTEYRVSAIPLGGYIRMYGDQFTDKVPDEEHKYSFLHQPVWKKSAIAFAGPFFNFVLPVVLFFFVFLGSQKVLQPVIGTVMKNQPAAVAGLKSGDKITFINNEPTDTFAKLVEIVSKNPGKPLKFTVKRQEKGSTRIFQKTVTPMSKQSPHPLYKDEKVGRIGVVSAVQKPVVAVPFENSAAGEAGLKTFDQIGKINDDGVKNNQDLWQFIKRSSLELKVDVTRNIDQTQKIIKKNLSFNLPNSFAGFQPVVIEKLKRFAITEDELENLSLQTKISQTKIALNQAQEGLVNTRGLRFIGGTISKITQSSPAMELGLKRGDQIVALNGQAVQTYMQINSVLFAAPDEIHVMGVLGQNKAQLYAFRMQEAENAKSMGGEVPKTLGFELEMPYTMGATKQMRVGVFTAIGRALERTGELTAMTIKSLWMLVSGNVSPSQLGGPIAIFNVAGDAAERGAAVYIFVMALISVNLGLLNLLPVPILDGGHLLMFAIEAIQRKPILVKNRQFATKIGLVFLLTLMALAIFNDVSRLLI